MAEGERIFTTAGRQINKPPLPKAGVYTLLVKGSSAETGKADRPDAKPYVYVPIELEGATPEGGRNPRVSQYFDTDLKPDARRGNQVPIDGGGQVTNLGVGIGEAVVVPMTTFNYADKDGNAQECDILDPTALKDWFHQRGDFRVKGRIRIKAANNGYPAKAVVAEFLPGDTTSTGSLFS